MRTIYLDHNATTQPAPEVILAMRSALEEYWQNPSSVHRPGQAVRQRIELAREQVCRLINCDDRELTFTSGGTESDMLAIVGSLQVQRGRRVIVTNQIEHSAVRELAEALAERDPDIDVIWLPVNINGITDCGALEDVLKQRGDAIAVVSIMWANNETGVIQPVETIGRLCREHGVRFHTDATQWVGKMPTDVASMPIDLMTFSGHKFHGPKGAGALYLRKGVRVTPQLVGHQERQRRAGTENVPGILGLGAAADVAMKWLATSEREHVAALRDRFERSILEAVEETSVNGGGAERLWSTSNIGFHRLEAEAVLLLLSERGVCASAGAACASGSLDPSPILLAMGIAPEAAHGAVRFSLGRETTREEIDAALQIVPAVIARLRESMPVA